MEIGKSFIFVFVRVIVISFYLPLFDESDVSFVVFSASSSSLLPPPSSLLLLLIESCAALLVPQ